MRNKNLPGSSTNLGKSELDSVDAYVSHDRNEITGSLPPDLTLVSQAIFTNKLKLAVTF